MLDTTLAPHGVSHARISGAVARFSARTVLALVCLAQLAGAAAAPAPLLLTPLKVSAHVYYFLGQTGAASAGNQGNMSNAAFVVTDDGVVVFDSLGTPVLGAAMLAAIATVTTQPVRRVIVSHYHADHVYGLQAFKARGAQIWAHENGRAYPGSDLANARLAQRRVELAPWVDSATRVLGADRWLHFDGQGAQAFEMGGVHFRLIDSSGAHSDEDLMLFVEEDRVLLAGDLYFNGRIPYVGSADSRAWLAALARMSDTGARLVVPGHGAASSQPQVDLQLTRDYLLYLREKMGAAVADMQSFDEAYQATDWRRFEHVPAFEQANRINASGTYLRMEAESLRKR